MVVYVSLMAFQLVGQRQAKHADYSTALKDGNAERNRAKALMPGETLLRVEG